MFCGNRKRVFTVTIGLLLRGIMMLFQYVLFIFFVCTSTTVTNRPSVITPKRHTGIKNTTSFRDQYNTFV
jgi:hypothetical protein